MNFLTTSRTTRLQRTIASLCLLAFPVAAFAASKPQPAASSADASATTAFVHVSVIPMDANHLLSDQTVLVRGDRIVSVGPASGVKVPAGATSIDATGQYIIPGFAASHAHVDSQSDFQSYLASGVTTVFGLDGSSAPWRDQIATGKLLGPTLYSTTDAKVSQPANADATGAALQQMLQQQVRSGRTPYQALQSVTVTPAKELHASREFGTVTKGSRADLVLLSANPLANISNTQRIAGVMVRGHWIPQSELQLIHVSRLTQPQHELQVTYVNGDGSMKYFVARI